MKHRKEFLRTCRFDFLLYKILVFHVKQVVNCETKQRSAMFHMKHYVKQIYNAEWPDGVSSGHST